MRARRAVSHAALLVATGLLVSSALSQRGMAQDASPYVPLQHWTMPYVEHLIARGVIPDPTPLTRPLKRADVVRVLREVDTLTVGEPVARTVRRLLEGLDSDRTGPRYRIAGDVGVTAATYARRDPLAAIASVGPRQAGPGHGTASGGLDLELLLGHVVAVTHPEFDTRLKYDPDWFGKKDRAIAGRTPAAYVAAQSRLGAVVYTRLDRNSGPSGMQALRRSDHPDGLSPFGF